MPKVTLSSGDIKKIAKLANLPLEQGQAETFADQFTATIDIVNELGEVDTSNISPTYQVNNLQNISREDEVDMARVLPQEVALRESLKSHNGYVVVPRIIDNS